MEIKKEGSRNDDSYVEEKKTFSVTRVYLKDLSLEQPNSPLVFLEKENPIVEVDLKVRKDKVLDNMYECVLTAVVRAIINEKILFLIEGSQAALIEVSDHKDIDVLLSVNLPNFLLPYLRVNIADLISRSGLPPFHLADFNFYELYADYLKQSQDHSSDL